MCCQFLVGEPIVSRELCAHARALLVIYASVKQSCKLPVLVHRTLKCSWCLALMPQVYYSHQFKSTKRLRARNCVHFYFVNRWSRQREYPVNLYLSELGSYFAILLILYLFRSRHICMIDMQPGMESREHNEFWRLYQRGRECYCAGQGKLGMKIVVLNSEADLTEL